MKARERKDEEKKEEGWRDGKGRIKRRKQKDDDREEEG